MTIERSQSRGKDQEKPKLFITNLDAATNPSTLEAELSKLFRKYGSIWKTSARLSKNGAYCFAFIDFERGSDIHEAVKNLDGYEIFGKPMKVQLQDDAKRRKDKDVGCYNCGKDGHFARECTSPVDQTYREKPKEKYRNRDEYGSRSRDKFTRDNHGNRRNPRSESKEFYSSSSSSRTNSSSSSRSSSEEYSKKRQRRIKRRRDKNSKKNNKDSKKRDQVTEEGSREKASIEKKKKRKSRKTDSSSSSQSSRSKSKFKSRSSK